MLSGRVAGNYPTRRPKQRPKSLPLQVEKHGEFETIALPVQEHPALLMLPLLKPSGILKGQAYTTGTTVSGYETLYFGKNPVDVVRELGVKTLRTTENWDISSFVRLLAKIAYSYSIAAGEALPREQVVILPLILGLADDASFWLGSADFKLAVESQNPLHALAYAWIPDPAETEKELLVVRVKLFVPSGATGYELERPAFAPEPQAAEAALIRLCPWAGGPDVCARGAPPHESGLALHHPRVLLAPAHLPT